MINISEIRISPEFAMMMSMENAEDQRKSNGKRNNEKYVRYVHAIQLLSKFLVADRGTAMADDPEEKLKFHNCLIHINNDEFDRAEIKQLTEILNLFDGMMLVGDSQGNTSFSLLMENIYD